MSRTARVVFVDGEPIGYFPPTNAENVEYGNTNVKLALDGLSSGKVNKSGDTMSGNLELQSNSEKYVKCVNTNTSVGVAMDVDNSGLHGIWSTGYNDGSYHADGKWLIYRDGNGDVSVNLTKIPFNSGEVALKSDVNDALIMPTITITTGDINDYLNAYDNVKIIVYNQQGGFTITNWLGNFDGYIVKIGELAIAFDGWDKTQKPYFKYNWGGWGNWVH